MDVELVCGKWKNIQFEALSVLIYIHTTQQDYKRAPTHCKAKSFTSTTKKCTQQLHSETPKFTHFQITILVHNYPYLKQCCFKYPCIRGHTKLHCIKVLMFSPMLISSRWHSRCWSGKSRKECIIKCISVRTGWRRVEMVKNTYVQFSLSCRWPWIGFSMILWTSVLFTQVLGMTH